MYRPFEDDAELNQGAEPPNSLLRDWESTVVPVESKIKVKIHSYRFCVHLYAGNHCCLSDSMGRFILRHDWSNRHDIFMCVIIATPTLSIYYYRYYLYLTTVPDTVGSCDHDIPVAIIQLHNHHHAQPRF